MKTGGEVQCVACNILEDDDLVNAVETTRNTFGAIHILVNNAGGGGGGRNHLQKLQLTTLSETSN